jgi:hypothetical protein
MHTNYVIISNMPWAIVFPFQVERSLPWTHKVKNHWFSHVLIPRTTMRHPWHLLVAPKCDAAPRLGIADLMFAIFRHRSLSRSYWKTKALFGCNLESVTKNCPIVTKLQMIKQYFCRVRLEAKQTSLKILKYIDEILSGWQGLQEHILTSNTSRQHLESKRICVYKRVYFGGKDIFCVKKHATFFKLKSKFQNVFPKKGRINDWDTPECVLV